MYENLRAELARKGKTLVELSQETGIRYQTLSQKLRGDRPLKLKEAIKIKQALNLDMSIEDLFGMKVDE